jgi:hypothetical protein
MSAEQYLVEIEIGFLQQAFPCMVFENLRVPYETPQRFSLAGRGNGAPAGTVAGIQGT